MPSEFRFLVMCLGATQTLDDRHVTLSGIVNELECRADERVELGAMVGVVLRPPMKGKSLDLMVWKLDKKGEPDRLPDYVGTPLILPHGLGPSVLPYSIKVPIRETGIYGFYLFDRDGVFGEARKLLATYMFSATVTK